MNRPFEGGWGGVPQQCKCDHCTCDPIVVSQGEYDGSDFFVLRQRVRQRCTCHGGLAGHRRGCPLYRSPTTIG